MVIFSSQDPDSGCAVKKASNLHIVQCGWGYNKDKHAHRGPVQNRVTPRYTHRITRIFF